MSILMSTRMAELDAIENYDKVPEECYRIFLYHSLFNDHTRFDGVASGDGYLSVSNLQRDAYGYYSYHVDVEPKEHIIYFGEERIKYLKYIGRSFKMIRSFLAVGQGAFYCEQFKSSYYPNINIVYDCGSSTDVRLVESQIRNNFEKGEVIQAVFISHLDEDHINGLPFLMRYCKVENLFFPLITQSEIDYIVINNIIKAGEEHSFAALFVNNPYRAFDYYEISRRPHLYQIQESIRNEDRYNNIDAISLLSGDDVGGRIFYNTDAKHPLKDKWLYIPYNFRQKDRITQLENELKIQFNRNIGSKEALDIWRNGTDEKRQKIKKAYEAVKGSFNTNSMILYSGLADDNTRQSYFNNSCYFCFYQKCHYKPAGCLYMGDYDASGKYKWNELCKAYEKVWKYIGCVQIPHHGSKYNYNPEFANMNAFFIMSAGRCNPYQHPHSIVIKDLLFCGHSPLIVTENKASEVNLVINI